MPSTHLRKNVLAPAKRVVVKLGSQLLARPDGKLDLAYLNQIAGQIAELRRTGREITVVSSGAVAAGCAELGLAERPDYVADQQAVAAVGQRRLMTHMHEAFAPHKLEVGQLLLTRSDFDDRARFLNIRHCVARLHQFGCVPILNENDTVAVEELRFGDNDMLAALTCNALSADALVILTVVDGLLDENGQVVDLVKDVNGSSRLIKQGADGSTPMGKGGMATKLEAAGIVTGAGEIAVIANGRAENVLSQLFDAHALGTVFLPADKKLDSRQRWIGLTSRPAGSVTVDQGAARALVDEGKSLLPIGITAVEGAFDQGQVVTVRDPEGNEIARGLSSYSAAEISRIMGQQSDQIEKILGRSGYASAIHRDDLVPSNAARSR